MVIMMTVTTKTGAVTTTTILTFHKKKEKKIPPSVIPSILVSSLFFFPSLYGLLACFIHCSGLKFLAFACVLHVRFPPCVCFPHLRFRVCAHTHTHMYIHAWLYIYMRPYYYWEVSATNREEGRVEGIHHVDLSHGSITDEDLLASGLIISFFLGNKKLPETCGLRGAEEHGNSKSKNQHNHGSKKNTRKHVIFFFFFSCFFLSGKHILRLICYHVLVSVA